MVLKYVEILITPAIAREMLRKNRTNRRWNRARSLQYAKDMKDGKWKLNGEAIKYYKDGSLADGQHRLFAIILADTPILMTVIYGIDNSVTVQDRGRNRSVSDVLQLRGYDKGLVNNRVVAMAKLHYYIQKNNANVSDGMVEDFIIKHSVPLTALANISPSSSASASKGVNVDTAVIKLPCFYAMNSGECDEGTIRAFLRVIKTGIPEALNQSAALVCRNDILSETIAIRGGSEYRKKAVFQIERAIQDFANGYPRKKSYARSTEPIYSNHINNREE